ncbi:Signal transduction histidine kinase [Aliiroseovarius sediminilitoris]|uniref:histidine kinase n=1 Tax=Aliiroseovarius sediminilitoris TaxID=1173584 RepID=A0A1I0R556_9RHOB|nr:ATP-binding protein [Aliiroseovarius sediminilitoris]SEW35617.1 Signal transduction histidine kinase [Aliiroseovarius sediminilitoris]
MTALRRFLPDGVAGRFALLLTVALVVANLIALALLSIERGRLDRAALIEREAERIVSLVPAIEAAEPGSRHAIARDASTRFSRVSVDPEPVVTEVPTAPRSTALTKDLTDALDGRRVQAAILVRPDRDGGHRSESIAVSILLASPDGGTTQWLNVRSRGERPRPPGLDEEVFFIVLGLSLVAVLGVSLLFLRRLTRPLRELATAARAAGNGDRSAHVAEEGPREMREAAAAFNDMQSRIARFDAERMRTLAAVGHDLRTPITSLRIRAELLDDPDGAAMIRTLDEMTVMANGLVSYAQGAREAESAEQVQLRDLLARLCDEQGAILAPGDAVTITARPVALARAFRNLIDNATRYGGAARLSLHVRRHRAVITIDDDGPGIPVADRESMFEPFVRGELSRNLETGGAGLGLSIARGIIAAHGGEIALTNRDEGGLRVSIDLPVVI